MRAIVDAITLARGWRRSAIALLAGAVGAPALAPFDFLPAMIVPMTVAVFLIDGATGKEPTLTPPLARTSRRRLFPLALRQAFGAGWWWGLGYFLAGLWWLGAAFLVEAEDFAWALPLGVVGLPAFLAIFPAMGFAFARVIWTSGSRRIFAFAAGLGLAEWLRGHVLTGFPWNSFGMALGDHIVPAQLASVVGLYGLTISTILLFAAPAAMVSGPSPAGARAAARSVSLRPLALALVGLAAIWGFGTLRLASAPLADVAGVKLRIMQPNLPPEQKFYPENSAAIMARYLELSQGVAGTEPLEFAGVTALIWPESAFPFILARDRGALLLIAALLPEGTVLVTGAARDGERRGTDRGFPDSIAFFNSVQVVDRGRITDTYDKVHLVPFGEYLPLQSWLAPLGLHQFVHIPGGFDPGERRRLLDVPGLPKVAPLVCYEAIFSGEVVPAGAERPGLLLNVTNDGWFGETAGPHQHFTQARLRAIEEGLPLVRGASTGISAILDPFGRSRAELPLGAAGAFDGPLPEAIAPPLFARFPFTAPFVLWAAALAVAASGRFASRTPGPGCGKDERRSRSQVQAL